MPPKKWDDEESDSSSDSDSPVLAPVVARRKFDDEEDDSDVLDSWDAAEDSEVEREKEKKAAEAKAKAAAAAAAAKKPKGQRIAEHQAIREAQKNAELDDDSDYEETEAERRERLRRTEQEADLAHAADMFGDIGISAGRSKSQSQHATVAVDAKDPTNTVDISKLPLFNPKTKTQFETLRNTLAPLISAHSKSAQYSLFLQDFSKALAKELPSDQIKKLASTLTALGNEKMKEEKAADKGGKKSKAAKTKTSLVAGRSNVADTSVYENDDFGDDDFM